MRSKSVTLHSVASFVCHSTHLLFIYLFTCSFVYECFASLYISVSCHAWKYPERPKEYMGSTETGGKSGHVGAGKRNKPRSSARKGSTLSYGNSGPSTVFKCPLQHFFSVKSLTSAV